MDHSIRAEVWEFLLGCYELGTTLAYRELVRQARRFSDSYLPDPCFSVLKDQAFNSLGIVSLVQRYE